MIFSISSKEFLVVFCFNLFLLIPNHFPCRVEAFGSLAAKDRNYVKFLGFFYVLACICPNLEEYHQFERVECEIGSGKTEFFYVRSTSTIRFYFARVFLRVPDFFVILKAGLHVRRKHKRKPRAPFSRVVSSRFTSGLCLCLCLCLRRTCRPAFNYPSLYVLDFSLELENEWKEILWHRSGGDSSSMLQSSFHSLFGFSGKFSM